MQQSIGHVQVLLPCLALFEANPLAVAQDLAGDGDVTVVVRRGEHDHWAETGAGTGPVLGLGQVERIGGFPGTITDLIIYQDQLYLRGSGQTQFKYESETASWQRNGPQDYQNKTLLGIDFLTVQDSIWLGLSSGWIVRSTDGGRTASRVLLEQRNHTWEAGLWYAGDGEYYCYLNNSLWRSTDFGRSFTKLEGALISAQEGVRAYLQKISR